MHERIIQRMAEWLLRRIGYVPILWHVDDVAACAVDYDIGFVPTRKECFEVLDNARENHNSEYGMNWDVIAAEIDAINPAQEGAAA